MKLSLRLVLVGALLGYGITVGLANQSSPDDSVTMFRDKRNLFVTVGQRIYKLDLQDHCQQ